MFGYLFTLYVIIVSSFGYEVIAFGVKSRMDLIPPSTFKKFSSSISATSLFSLQAQPKRDILDQGDFSSPSPLVMSPIVWVSREIIMIQCILLQLLVPYFREII
jgi:hypothetical protein